MPSQHLNFSRNSAKADYVDIVQVATLPEPPGQRALWHPAGLEPFPPAKLGLDPNVDMQADDLSAAMEVATSMLQ